MSAMLLYLFSSFGRASRIRVIQQHHVVGRGEYQVPSCSYWKWEVIHFLLHNIDDEEPTVCAIWAVAGAVCPVQHPTYTRCCGGLSIRATGEHEHVPARGLQIKSGLAIGLLLIACHVLDASLPRHFAVHVVGPKLKRSQPFVATQRACNTKKKALFFSSCHVGTQMNKSYLRGLLAI
jgi:hypothetical protein